MAVYLIARGIGYHREGIDDIGDIYEIFDGPEPPSGPGYALSDIIRIEVLPREDVNIVLNIIRPAIYVDPETEIRYWQNPEDDLFYEVKIRPKYDLNVSDFTLADRVTLADENATSVEQIAVLNKLIINYSKYDANTETLRPGEEAVRG